MRFYRTTLFLITTLALSATALAEDQPKISATLISEHSAINPGGQTTLAVKLEIPDDWHIYHPILLDTGLPTTLELTLPKGITTAGPVRYPKPTFSSIDTGGEPIRYLGYEGEVVLLVDLEADESIKPDTSAKVDALITALICEDNGKCIPVDTQASIKLPIHQQPGELQEKERFASAREALPNPLAESPYLKGSTLSFKHSRIPIGGESELILTLNIAKHHHIQDRDPGVDGLIATSVWIEPLEGITFDTDKQTWPKASIEEIEYLGKARQQSGKIEIRTPFKITDKLFKPGEVTVRVLIEYQTCADDGQCFPPEQAIAAATFEAIPEGSEAVAWQTPKHPTLLGWPADVVSAESASITANAPEGSKAAGSDTSDQLARSDTPQDSTAATGLFGILLAFGGAFLGGIILNIMPCVLPVVSLKIFGFVNQAGEDKSRVLKMGLVYAAGVLLSFLPLAIVIPAIGAAWGGVIMQEPVVVILLSGFVLTFGLSMVGLYEIQLPGSVSAGGSVPREGYGGAFMSGLLTTVLATPCTGPFLGSAIGTLATLPPIVSFLGIMLVGAGLAFPYVILSAVPAWLKFLPKPGNWMITFKQITGWILLAVPLWLLWNLSKFDDAALLFGAIVFLFGVGLASFLFSQIDLQTSGGKTARVITTAVLTMLVGWYVGPVYMGGILAEPESDAPTINFVTSTTCNATSGSQDSNHSSGTQPISFDVAALYPAEGGPKLAWQEWHPDLPEQLSRAGYTVYVDFTAAWCLTCQSNKATVLHTDEIYELFKEQKVVPLKADFTRKNPAIKQALRRFNRNGVPLNIIYPAGKPDEVITLPELLTQSVVSDRLKQAGPSSVASDSATDNQPIAAR
jgi:thiol:disulfide interchange protein